MASKYAKKFAVPDEFPNLLRDFTREYLRHATEGDAGHSKEDIYRFGYEYFTALIRDGAAKRRTREMTGEQLTERIMNMFAAADADRNGFLDHREFKALLKTFADELSLTTLDVKRVMAEADENDDGVVNYDEFVPVAVDLVQSILAKQQFEDRDAARGEDAEEAARALMIHGMAREELESLMADVFRRADSDNNGWLTRAEFQRCIREADLGLTRKEINLLMMEVDEDDDSRISYDEFVPLCFNLLVQIMAQEIKNESMPAHESDLRAFFQDLFSSADAEETGVLHHSHVKDLIRRADLGLTSIQIATLMSEAREDEGGYVAHGPFASVAAGIVASMVNVMDNAQARRRMGLSEDGSLATVNGFDRETFELELANLATPLSPADEHGMWVPRDELRAALEGSSLRLSDRQVNALLGLVEVDEEGYVDAEVLLRNGFRALQEVQAQELLGVAPDESGGGGGGGGGDGGGK